MLIGEYVSWDSMLLSNLAFSRSGRIWGISVASGLGISGPVCVNYHCFTAAVQRRLLTQTDFIFPSSPDRILSSCWCHGRVTKKGWERGEKIPNPTALLELPEYLKPIAAAMCRRRQITCDWQPLGSPLKYTVTIYSDWMK